MVHESMKMCSCPHKHTHTHTQYIFVCKNVEIFIFLKEQNFVMKKKNLFEMFTNILVSKGNL
jgi:hypothetical protein